MSVIEEIAAERTRQIAVEGWTLEHDDQFDTGALARAAACYTNAAADVTANPHALWGAQNRVPDEGPPSRCWPWARRWWKFTDPRRALIKAAALIVAEIERLDRVPTGLAKGPSGD